MTYAQAKAAKERILDAVRMAAAVHEPNHEAARAVWNQWADRPPTAEERLAFTIVALHDRMKEKCALLRTLIAPEDSVMQDVDQACFGLVAEVISQIGGLPDGLTWGRCYRVAMDAAIEWAEEHGESTRIVRAGKRKRSAPPPADLGIPDGQMSLFAEGSK